ncbi:MAG: hormogonium polysaccharide biosynthesis glycosyltransferase HpsE [Cyanobacteria bacterium P01_A01_bin.105]
MAEANSKFSDGAVQSREFLVSSVESSVESSEAVTRRRAVKVAPKALKSRAFQRLSRLRPIFSRWLPDQVCLDFTVVIPTYNGARRLPAVLDCLCWQLGLSDLGWEVIVVDNNSTDATAEVVRRYQTDWPTGSTLRYVFEPRQGAGNARTCGIHAANSELVGFLDDDNLPGLTWVQAAYRFGQDNPRVGVYGSRIQGDFETTPPRHFERISSLLALTERGSGPIPYLPERKVLPPGAGLVVRRQAWLDHVPHDLVMTQKIGQREAGEDLEVVLHIQKAGWEVWYNPHMRVAHRIPRQRLTRQYLVTLCRGIGLSRCHTRMLSVRWWQRPVMLLVYMANDVRKILAHLLRYRWLAVEDTVTACELALYWYSLLSPFFMAYRYGTNALSAMVPATLLRTFLSLKF